MSQSLKLTILSLSGQERTLTYHKAFADFTGSIVGALMLSQLLYLHDEEDPWTPMPYAEWQSMFGDPITRYKVDQARKAMEAGGYLRTELRKAQGAPTLHYRLDVDAFLSAWRAYLGMEEEREPVSEDAGMDALLNVPPASVSPDVAVKVWNRMCDELPDEASVPSVRKVTAQRRKWVGAKREDLWPHMREIVDRILHNPFLQGREGKKGWSISFNWLWKYENNYTKVVEGNYDDADVRTGDERPAYLTGTGRPATGDPPNDDSHTPEDGDVYSDVGFQ